MTRFVFFLCTWALTISGICCGDSSPCENGDTGIYAHPEACQLYYNCSLPKSESKPWLGDHVMECVYPDLFNTETLRCEQFQDVQCDSRNKYDNACEYLNNLCGQEFCRPCRSDFSCSENTGSLSGSPICDYTSSKLMQELTCPRDEQGNMKILDASICSSVK